MSNENMVSRDEVQKIVDEAVTKAVTKALQGMQPGAVAPAPATATVQFTPSKTGPLREYRSETLTCTEKGNYEVAAEEAKQLVGDFPDNFRHVK